MPVRPVSPFTPVCRLSYCKDNANWHNYKIKICQRSHYFSSLPFKMTFFSQFALLHHVLRKIIYDFFISHNAINHSRPVIRNIDMCVASYPNHPINICQPLPVAFSHPYIRIVKTTPKNCKHLPCFMFYIK